jgi:uncharacterized protein YkwD
MGVARALTVIAFALVAPSGASGAVPANDGAALRAVAASCSGAAAAAGDARSRLAAMSCGVNVIRRSFGLVALRESALLDRSSLLKANAVRRCGFSHTPCGIAFTQTFARAGYLPARSIAENLAWGQGVRGSPLRTLGSWLASPQHRANLLGPRWRDLGAAVERGSMFGRSGVSLWVLQLGRRA